MAHTHTHTQTKANDNCYTHSYDYDYCYDDNVLAIVVVAVIVWLFALLPQWLSRRSLSQSPSKCVQLCAPIVLLHWADTPTLSSSPFHTHSQCTEIAQHYLMKNTCGSRALQHVLATHCCHCHWLCSFEILIILPAWWSDTCQRLIRPNHATFKQITQPHRVSGVKINAPVRMDSVAVAY